MAWRRLNASNWRVSAVALCVLSDLSDRFEQLRRQAAIVCDFFGAAEHDGQDVVEVVRDAAGQLADGLELL